MCYNSHFYRFYSFHLARWKKQLTSLIRFDLILLRAHGPVLKLSRAMSESYSIRSVK